MDFVFVEKTWLEFWLRISHKKPKWDMQKAPGKLGAIITFRSPWRRRRPPPPQYNPPHQLASHINGWYGISWHSFKAFLDAHVPSYQRVTRKGSVLYFSCSKFEHALFYPFFTVHSVQRVKKGISLRPKSCFPDFFCKNKCSVLHDALGLINSKILSRLLVCTHRCENYVSIIRGKYVSFFNVQKLLLEEIAKILHFAI